MRFPEPDGTKDSNLSLPLIYGGHHVREDDQTTDEKDNDRYPHRKFLEMVQSLHLSLKGLFDGCHFGMGQFLRDLPHNLFNGAGVTVGRDLDQAQASRFF